VTVWADGMVTINGAAGPGTAGAFDFGGMSNWSVRGRAIGAGFFFNGSLVNATSARKLPDWQLRLQQARRATGWTARPIRADQRPPSAQIVSCDLNTCGRQPCFGIV